MQRKFLVIMLAAVMAWLAAAAPALALADGTYNVVNSTSYTNPDTGKTDDGGSNLDIGEAMARSLTQPLMLYEVKEKKQYLTIRIGLSSYITDMRISTQAEKNRGTGYQPVPFDVVKENKETDTTEYRFEVESLDLRVRLTFFVGPMNRDVIYFITPDSSSVKADEGAFAASDKASGGYSSGFAGGLTGGNAEEGKMPALVEQLTGISQVEPKQETGGQGSEAEQEIPAPSGNTPPANSPPPSAEPAPSPIAEQQPPQGTQDSSVPPSSPPQENLNQQQLPEAAAESEEQPETTHIAVSEKEQPAALPVSQGDPPSREGHEKQQEEAAQLAPSGAASPAASSSATSGLEGKIPAGSTANLAADQGLTQFDGAGNRIEEPLIAEQSTSLIPVIGAAAGVVAGLFGYYLYSRSRKRV